MIRSRLSGAWRRSLPLQETSAQKTRSGRFARMVRRLHANARSRIRGGRMPSPLPSIVRPSRTHARPRRSRRSWHRSTRPTSIAERIPLRGRRRFVTGSARCATNARRARDRSEHEEGDPSGRRPRGRPSKAASKPKPKKLWTLAAGNRPRSKKRKLPRHEPVDAAVVDGLVRYITEVQRGKIVVSKKERTTVQMELGCAWGEQLHRALSWQWANGARFGRSSDASRREDPYVVRGRVRHSRMTFFIIAG